MSDYQVDDSGRTSNGVRIRTRESTWVGGLAGVLGFFVAGNQGRAASRGHALGQASTGQLAVFRLWSTNEATKTNQAAAVPA